MKQRYKVLIDTDIGDDIDDALALALALHCPEIDLLAVTTVFGDTWSRARLAAHLLHVFGHADVPVAAGIAMPLQLRHQPSGVPQAAILDPDASFPALSTTSGPALIVKTALASPGQLTLLCLGPLTNVATALQLEPQLFMAIRSVVMMGGTSGVPFPEWNVRSDTRAAHIVLAAGIPITMIGWNVTTRCQMRTRDVEQLRRAASSTDTPVEQTAGRLAAPSPTSASGPTLPARPTQHCGAVPSRTHALRADDSAGADAWPTERLYGATRNGWSAGTCCRGYTG